jgi:hypothetical protein
LLLVSDGVNALCGELRTVTGVEVGGEGTDGGSLIGGGDVVLVIDVSTDEVEELLSGHVTEGVSLWGVGLPRGVGLDLVNELLSDGVLLGSGECGNSASNDELEHNL